ncbi:hypothetical protein Pogu_0938 [Pyrobaculum oguniense TE7]|uniref:ArnR1-like winged helix-turn-helix domain-containing protein n=1 Tax=Pyrobaculum oguniense (strain DSM 13380 / JCM 10595 / TE7) TaxID=698757 RepID=H6Q8F8_PYROT|nr:hypothetical protein Pogu_0938 [Pyrobaculum oguniense TE7]
MRKSGLKPDLYILYRISATFKAQGPMMKTALATAARLNYRRALRYVEYMKERGLVEEEEELALTKAGTELLERIEEILEKLGLSGFGRGLGIESQSLGQANI